MVDHPRAVDCTNVAQGRILALHIENPIHALACWELLFYLANPSNQMYNGGQMGMKCSVSFPIMTRFMQSALSS